ncbi:hypothetical protein HDU97_007354 [Phlyctochytrium planicorne]|nr:hypothetical protein HDU97_007354 [Phlyctochytrium planicorne]
MTESKTVSFLVRSTLTWQVWKETQPDLHWFFERNFGAFTIDLLQTGEEKAYIVELEMSSDNIGKLEKAFKDGSLAVEIDKIHGMDPLTHGKKDAKLSRLSIVMGPARPQNTTSRKTIEALEEQILKLEQLERTRSIDLKGVMEGLQAFQLEVQKRMENLERKFEETTSKIDSKCDKLEKTLARYRK